MRVSQLKSLLSRLKLDAELACVHLTVVSIFKLRVDEPSGQRQTLGQEVVAPPDRLRSVCLCRPSSVDDSQPHGCIATERNVYEHVEVRDASATCIILPNGTLIQESERHSYPSDEMAVERQ